MLRIVLQQKRQRRPVARKLRLKQLLFLLLVLSPACALAKAGGDQLSSALTGLISLLTSTPARLLFVIAIIGVGYGTLALGKIPKERAIAIFIGIGIVYSASYIANTLNF